MITTLNDDDMIVFRRQDEINRQHFTMITHRIKESMYRCDYRGGKVSMVVDRPCLFLDQLEKLLLALDLRIRNVSRLDILKRIESAQSTIDNIVRCGWWIQPDSEYPKILKNDWRWSELEWEEAYQIDNLKNSTISLLRSKIDFLKRILIQSLQAEYNQKFIEALESEMVK